MQSVEHWQQCRCLQSVLTRGLDTCPTDVAAAMKCYYWSHSFHCSCIPARPVFWAGVVPWAPGCYIGIGLSNSDPSCPDSSTVSSLPSIHPILSHGKTLQGNFGTNISTFYSNFPIVKYWDLICISPLSNKPFHEIIFQGKFKFFLVVPQGNFLKKFVVNCPTYVSCALPPSLSSLGSIRRRRRVRTATGIYMHPLLQLILRDLITLYI
jgi:hypothetical protein